MYLYFDKTGTLKEIINNEAIRQGNQNYNKVYCYFETGIDFSSGLFWKLKYPNGTESNDVSFLGTQYEENGQVPYNKDVDYKYFKDFVTYNFHVFNLTTYLSQDGLYKLTITAYPTQSTANVLGTVTFNAESSVIESDPELTQSQYSYLLGLIGEWVSSINSKVDKQTPNGKGKVTNTNSATEIERTENNYKSAISLLGDAIKSIVQNPSDASAPNTEIKQEDDFIRLKVVDPNYNNTFTLFFDATSFYVFDNRYSETYPVFQVSTANIYFKGQPLLTSVNTADIVDKAVTKAKLSQELQDFLDDLVTSIPDNSVTTSKIVDKAVTKAKLSQALQDIIDALGYESNQFNVDSADIVLTDREESLGSALNGIEDEIAEIEDVIPSGASINDKLTTESQVNDKINSVSAYYITSNAQGDAFATLQALTGASVYYSGGEVRIPTRNDYAIVLSDSSHDNATTRYSYQNGWQYQYTVNETALTQAQLDALNSGITATKVGNYDGHLSNTNNPHNVTKAQVGLGNVVNKGMDNTPTSSSDNYVKSGGVYSDTRSMVNALALSGTSGTLSASELSALNRGYGVDYVILGGTTILIKSGLQESQYVYFRFSSLTSGAENDNIGSLYNLELKVNLSNGAWELVKNNQNQALYYNRIKVDTLLAGKQPLLESGTNIKTVNGTSLLGSGDIAISSLDLGARYLLGAFDSADGKTRRTRVGDLSDIDWLWEANDLRWRSANKISDIYYTTEGSYVPEIKSAKYPTMSIQEQNTSTSVIGITTYEGYIYLRNGSSTEKPSGKYEYESTVYIYTDTPIEGESILPLDTTMANKIRQKVVDGLNLLTGELYINPYNNYGFLFECKKTGTYTFSIPDVVAQLTVDKITGTYESQATVYNANSLTTTLTAGISYGLFINNGDWDGALDYKNIAMLTKSNHPYPHSDFNQKEHITNAQAELLKSEYEKCSNLCPLGTITQDISNSYYRNTKILDKIEDTTLTISYGFTVNSGTYPSTNGFAYGYGDSDYETDIGYKNIAVGQNNFQLDIPSSAVGKQLWVRFVRQASVFSCNYTISNIMLNYGDTPEPYHDWCGEILHEVDRPKLYRHFVKLYFGDSDYSYVGEVIHEKATALTYDDLKALYPSEYKQLQLYPADPNIEDAVGNTPSYSSNYGAKITSAYFYYNSASATPNQVFTCVMYIGPTNKLVAEERVYYENYTGTTDFNVVISDSVEEM